MQRITPNITSLDICNNKRNNKAIRNAKSKHARYTHRRTNVHTPLHNCINVTEGSAVACGSVKSKLSSGKLFRQAKQRRPANKI